VGRNRKTSFLDSGSTHEQRRPPYTINMRDIVDLMSGKMIDPPPVSQREARRRDEERCDEIRSQIEAMHKATIGSCDALTSEDKSKEMFFKFCDDSLGIQRELLWIQQRPIREAARGAGIMVPKEHWDSSDIENVHVLLTYQGEQWVRRQLIDFKREKWKFWVGIFIPLGR
jgi:hypothetical protein